MVRKWFGRLHQSDFNLNDQPYPGWPSNVRNKPKILMEEIVKTLKINCLLPFEEMLQTCGCDILWQTRTSLIMFVAISLLLCHEKENYTELSQAMKNGSFMIMFKAIDTGNKLVNVQNTYLKQACIQWLCCCPFGGIAEE